MSSQNTSNATASDATASDASASATETPTQTERMRRIRAIANAVLYEGYLLYPYHPSAVKNRQRWTFGVVYPREYSEAQGGVEPWQMRTECLLAGEAATEVEILVRFLQLCACARAGEASAGAAGGARPGTETWEEGIERDLRVGDLRVGDLLAAERRLPFAYPAARWTEETVAREQQPLAGALSITAERVGEGIYRLRVVIANTTPGTAAVSNRRDAALPHSLISTHTLLHTQGGAFVSLLDPPAELAPLAASCQNRRTWPVLVGNDGERTTMLSSPIILYDYPQIAPESPGPLFDGAEIDELLTLRILTLSDEEKAELRHGDARARELLERTEALSRDDLMKLHGAIRELRPLGAANRTGGGESVEQAGPALKVGDHVRLRPSARADAFDLLLAGKTARVEALQEDFEGRSYLVVTLDDDPGREQKGERVLPGHRFFFYPEEAERLEAAPWML